MESHLLQMRGLKRLAVVVILPGQVASFTDAWIETSDNAIKMSGLGRIFYRCVD